MPNSAKAHGAGPLRLLELAKVNVSHSQAGSKLEEDTRYVLSSHGRCHVQKKFSTGAIRLAMIASPSGMMERGRDDVTNQLAELSCNAATYSSTEYV